MSTEDGYEVGVKTYVIKSSLHWFGSLIDGIMVNIIWSNFKYLFTNDSHEVHTT